MNEAKKKADELVDKFDLPTGLMSRERIQCALIAVNEVLNARPVYPSLKNYTVDCMREAKQFWQAVKEELESRL